MTTSEGSYKLLVFGSGRYQSIGNSGNVVERVNWNGHVNKQNQRQNVMFLQQNSNVVDSNGCPPEDALLPRRYGSTWYLECYYCHEWGNISNNWPQIPTDCVRGGGSGHGEVTRNVGRSSTVLL